MSKRRKKVFQIPSASDVIIQNEPPRILWHTFEQFWNESVKNGTQFTMMACKEHVRALGLLDQPNRWIEAVLHFGIEVEK